MFYGKLELWTPELGDERCVASATFNREDSLTRQSEKEEADINVLVRRFGLTGHIPMSHFPPTFGDFEGVSDYREALDAIRSADSAFMSLDADVRARFRNDPAELLDYVYAEGRTRAELEEIGFVEKVAVPVVQKVEVVNPVVPPVKP